ncbi:MAG: hypothetical protein AAGC64_00445 [Bacteroidota bacterium]
MRVIVAIFIFSFFYLDLFSQKIKYKELFPLLAEKNYAEGGPLLKQYLATLKKEEANPNLHMGLMLEHQFLDYDIVEDSTKIYSSGDSSMLYLSRAKSLIDDKELRKNDEYYRSFYDRNLKTGEFEIKASDIHTKIDKRVASIEQRISRIKALHRAIDKVEKYQMIAMKEFESIIHNYSNYNELLLSIDDKEQTRLTKIRNLGSQALAEAQTIKMISEELGSDWYLDEIDLQEINDFGQDGLTSFDLKKGSITLWDYEAWAKEIWSEMKGGVGLFKTSIISYINELRKKKALLKKSISTDGLFVPKDLLELFDKYDPESAVNKLIKVETFESRVIKLVDLQINPDLLDSSKIGSQLEIYAQAKKNVDSMYATVHTITAEGLFDAKKKYPDYIKSFFNSYGTASKYVEEMKEWSARNKEWLTNSVNYWTEANRWGVIVKPGEPELKIPLFVSDSNYNEYKILRVNKFTPPQVIVYGANTSSKKGYIGSFGEDRTEQWSIEFALPNSEEFKYITDTIPSPERATGFYVYDEIAEEKNLSIVSYTDTGLKKWAVNVSVSKRPVDFMFDDLTQELTILLYPEERLPLDSDELGYFVIDKTGNVR